MYCAKRLSDNYEEEFTSFTDFANKHNLTISGVWRCVKKECDYTKNWVFKLKSEKNYPNPLMIRYIAKRVIDGYEEKVWDKEQFADKHKLDFNKLCLSTRVKNKVYKDGKNTWVFRKDIKGTTYPEVNLYLAIRLSDGYKEEFNQVKKFSDKYYLDKSNVARALRNERGFKTVKGWEFKILKEKMLIGE